MNVETSHHIDASDPDTQGMYDWYYEYDLFRFREGDISLIARSYVDTPQEVAFLCWEQNNRQTHVHKDEFSHPLFQFALQYLRSAGKTVIRFLASEGYESISPTG